MLKYLFCSALLLTACSDYSDPELNAIENIETSYGVYNGVIEHCSHNTLDTCSAHFDAENELLYLKFIIQSTGNTFHSDSLYSLRIIETKRNQL